MEYIDGCTLKDALKFQPVWDVNEALKFGLQLCEALHGLHMYGLAHRDLKPENVMLTREWEVRLMDFGLVKDAQGLLKLFESEDIMSGRDFAENIDKAMLAGTPEYMAPEQFSDPMVQDEHEAKTDTWTDVYSTALILFQLMTGDKLFPFKPTAKDQKGYARELLAYIRSRTEAQDHQLRKPAAVPDRLWPVLSSALRSNPKQRPAQRRRVQPEAPHVPRAGRGRRVRRRRAHLGREYVHALARRAVGRDGHDGQGRQRWALRARQGRRTAAQADGQGTAARQAGAVPSPFARARQRRR
jgi:serine/threonine protein kinase